MKLNLKKKRQGQTTEKENCSPKFKNEREIREYILQCSLELTLELREIATKKNNIKKHNIANAKNQQYKTALTSLKVANDILKDLQINKLEEKLELMEEGLIASTVASDNVEESSAETFEKIEKLTELTEALAEMKD